METGNVSEKYLEKWWIKPNDFKEVFKFSVNKRVGCAIKVKMNFSYTLNINNNL